MSRIATAAVPASAILVVTTECGNARWSMISTNRAPADAPARGRPRDRGRRRRLARRNGTRTIVTLRPGPALRYFSTWTRLLKSSVHNRQSLRTSTSVAASVSVGSIERFAAVGQQQPVAAACQRVLAFVGDVDHEQGMHVRQALDDRNQVQEPVRDVERDDAAGLHVPPIDAERFRRDEVHGYRVARERVDHQHVEILLRLALERQARVAQLDLDGRLAVAKVGEVALRDVEDGRIDFVEAIDIALGSVDGQRAGAEADHADLERRRRGMQRFEQASDARRARVVGRRELAQVVFQVLRAVQDRAVDQRPAMVGVVPSELLHAQHAVEVPGGRRSCRRRTRGWPRRRSRPSSGRPPRRARRTRDAPAAPARAAAARRRRARLRARSTRAARAARRSRPARSRARRPGRSSGRTASGIGAPASTARVRRGRTCTPERARRRRPRSEGRARA